MAFTRFKYDECRTIKELQQATDVGKWILNVPGNGDMPCYMEDPHIIPQKWGGNLRTNTIHLESELRGVNRQLGRDCIGKDEYTSYLVNSQAIQYPSCSTLTTDQSRATHPAWWYRDLEQSNWQHLPLNPQINTCFSFQNNISTRILEKDYFTPKRDCVLNENKQMLPSSFTLIRNGN
jgi:hypothetical protein